MDLRAETGLQLLIKGVHHGFGYILPIFHRINRRIINSRTLLCPLRRFFVNQFRVSIHIGHIIYAQIYEDLRTSSHNCVNLGHRFRCKPFIALGRLGNPYIIASAYRIVHLHKPGVTYEYNFRSFRKFFLCGH